MWRGGAAERQRGGKPWGCRAQAHMHRQAATARAEADAAAISEWRAAGLRCNIRCTLAVLSIPGGGRVWSSLVLGAIGGSWCKQS